MPRKSKSLPRAVGNSQEAYPDAPRPAGPAVVARPQPVRAPTGLEYGQRQQLEQAQQVAPLPQTPPLQQTMSDASALEFPSARLADQSQRPAEPVTAGLPIGPGPGPEALGANGGRPISTVLSALAAVSNDADIRELARTAERRNV